MELIIYKTKLFRRDIILQGVVSLLMLTFIFWQIMPTWDTIRIMYPMIILMLFTFYILAIKALKIFILTRSTFRIEYPLVPFRMPIIIPLKDIEKLVFDENPGGRKSPFIEIYRISNGKSVRHECSLNVSDIQNLIDKLREQKIRIETKGDYWN